MTRRLRPSKVSEAVSYSSPIEVTLETLWRKTCAEVYGGFQPSLTLKHKKQLNDFAKRCPEGEAGSIVEYLVRNWIAFAKTAETKAGLYRVPSEPSIDFLLRNIGIAVNMYLTTAGEHEAKKPDADEVQTPCGIQHQQPPVVSLEPVQLIAQDDKKPTSLSELDEIWNSD